MARGDPQGGNGNNRSPPKRDQTPTRRCPRSDSYTPASSSNRAGDNPAQKPMTPAELLEPVAWKAGTAGSRGPGPDATHSAHRTGSRCSTCSRPTGFGLGWSTPRCQAPARPAEDRCAGFGVAAEGRRRQMPRPSFVPPRRHPPASGPTRYQIDQVEVRDRGEEAGRELLETPGSSCRWWPRTSSASLGGRCWPAMIAGERDPDLAEMARSRMRLKSRC